MKINTCGLMILHTQATDIRRGMRKGAIKELINILWTGHLLHKRGLKIHNLSRKNMLMNTEQTITTNFQWINGRKYTVVHFYTQLQGTKVCTSVWLLCNWYCMIQHKALTLDIKSPPNNRKTKLIYEHTRGTRQLRAKLYLKSTH